MAPPLDCRRSRRLTYPVDGICYNLEPYVQSVIDARREGKARLARALNEFALRLVFDKVGGVEF